MLFFAPALRFWWDLCVFVCVCVCVCVYRTISYLTCCTASTNTDVEYMTYAVVEHGLSCMEYAQCMLRENRQTHRHTDPSTVTLAAHARRRLTTVTLAAHARRGLMKSTEVQNPRRILTVYLASYYTNARARKLATPRVVVAISNLEKIAWL